MNRVFLVLLTLSCQLIINKSHSFEKKEHQTSMPAEFKVLKYIFKNKKLKKIIKKPEYEYGPVQIGPGAPVIAKAIIGLKRKIVYIENKKFIYEEIQLGKRLGIYLNLGASKFSYWKIKALYSEGQIPKESNSNLIIESLSNRRKTQPYKRLEVSHYFGEDLIAGIESPKYLLNFYNLAIRNNFIKKNFFKKVFHNHTKKYLKISEGNSSEYLGRFFSELYGIDQNHFLQNNETNFTKTNSYPFPTNPKVKNLGFILSTLNRVKDRTIDQFPPSTSPAWVKELQKIKKASLFGIISKKWIKNYLKKHSGHKKSEIFSQAEKSKWTTFIIKEFHSLYLGISTSDNKCHALINIHLKDSKMTKKEKTLYMKNYNAVLDINDSENITANRQIYLNKKGIKQLTGTDCHKQDYKLILKRIKALASKKFHDYNVHKLISSIRQDVSTKNFTDYSYINIGNKIKIKIRDGRFRENENEINEIKLDFINQF